MAAGAAAAVCLVNTARTHNTAEMTMARRLFASFAATTARADSKIDVRSGRITSDHGHCIG